MKAMEAMDYEYLIRAVFKCGRTRRFGADADIFRGLERASVPFPGQKSIDQYKLGFKIGEVTAYLYTALYEVQEQYKDLSSTYKCNFLGADNKQ